MSGRLLSASLFLVATNSQFPRVEAWKKFRQNMNIINEQARANSKKTQHDASANVLLIRYKKVNSKKKLKKTMKIKPLTKCWGNREKDKIYCYEYCSTDRHEKILVKRKGRDNKLYN